MYAITSLLAGICALASLTRAAPLVSTKLEIVTVTTWETVNTTTTVWLPLASSPILVFSTSTTTPLLSSTSTSSSTSASLTPSAASSTPVYTAPAVTTSSTTTPVAIVSSSPVAAAPVQSTGTAAPVSSSSAAPSASAGSFVQASNSNTCEGEGNACVGDVTHWDGGLGACGWNVNTASDLSVALPVGLMGAQSNGNPYCGRSVTLLNPVTGTTVQAKVGDKCMGCVNRALDCTDALFTAITDGKGDGRMSGIEWWFT